MLQVLNHFQFEMLCISNHTACHFTEKRGFSAYFGADGVCRLAYCLFQRQNALNVCCGGPGRSREVS